MTGFPHIFEVRVPAGSFIAEVIGVDAFTFGDEFDSIVVGHFIRSMASLPLSQTLKMIRRSDVLFTCMPKYPRCHPHAM